MTIKHAAIQTGAGSDTGFIIRQLLSGKLLTNYLPLTGLKGVVFGQLAINELIKEEMVHDHVTIKSTFNSNLKSMSSGEQKKALLQYLLALQPGFIVVDDLLDNLDQQAQQQLMDELTAVSKHTLIIQIINRKKDILPFIEQVFLLEKNKVAAVQSLTEYLAASTGSTNDFKSNIPPPLTSIELPDAPIVEFKNVNVQFDGRPVLNNISWVINAGEFWQLKGPNGSGKSTMLSMITGDSVKGYGQDLFLFGKKKGSGETVWELKQKMGYLNPTLTQFFPRLDSAERMVLSGFFDSIGLYTIPSELQLQTAHEWLRVIGLYEQRNEPFCFLPVGKQRMVLVARAMVKHPPLLILDEPTTGLSDTDIEIFTALINRIAAEATTAILYVSHRPEQGLVPQFVYELVPGENGSTGKVIQTIKN